MTPEGLPHSEIPGSVPVCGSPGLIAACHVLHRFSAPRHPPSTLSSLTIKYLRRESSISTRLLLSKTLITADQKAPRCCQGAFSSALQADVIRVRKLVELTGIEPATYGLQSRRSPS
jgi:hypothetical protein